MRSFFALIKIQSQNAPTHLGAIPNNLTPLTSSQYLLLGLLSPIPPTNHVFTILRYPKETIRTSCSQMILIKYRYKGTIDMKDLLACFDGFRSEEPAACIGCFFFVDVRREIGHDGCREGSEIAKEGRCQKRFGWLVRQGAKLIRWRG